MSGDYAHENKHCYRKRGSLKLNKPLLPSRRRPWGYYTFVGVSPNATFKQIAVKLKFLRSTLSNSSSASSQARAAATKKLRLIEEAERVLLSTCRTEYDELLNVRRVAPATKRVRLHRSALSQAETKEVSAITYCRLKLKKRKKPSERDGTLVHKRPCNVNNRYARKWVVRRRPPERLLKDKRLGPFEVSAE